MERALKRAAEVDDHLKQTGTVIGPLHGLPISLKDQICIEGIETVMGALSPLMLSTIILSSHEQVMLHGSGNTQLRMRSSLISCTSAEQCHSRVRLSRRR